MRITVRIENTADHEEVFQLIQAAFENEEHTDHTEQYLVKRLRNAPSFIPELSLVAEVESKIIGHILLTSIQIVHENIVFNSLALAPVSVLPKYQRKGVGSKLILAAHEKAMVLGHHSVCLLGHHDYYPRFGYQKASEFNISFPFDAPDENCMAIELTPNALKSVSGKIQYPKAFFQ